MAIEPPPPGRVNRLNCGSTRTRQRRRQVNVKRRAASLLFGVVLAACASAPVTPTPAGSSAPAPSPSPASTFGSTASPTPSTPTPAASPATTDSLVGETVVTVSGNLVVRSEPRVSDDSSMYQPWLPLGTELTVLDGPVNGSGYTWYKVAPVSFAGLSGPGYGWVAMASKDGDPWIALAAGPTGPSGVELAQANVARATANPKDARTAATSISAFGLDLYRALLADPSLRLATRNVVFSPTSIALALGMARAGARGATAAEMDHVLHASGWEALGAGLNALDQALASRNTTWPDYEGKMGELALRIANAAFAQRGWTIEQAFLDAIAAAFGAGLRLVDYIANPEAARTAINRWVSDQTAGRVPELLGPLDVTNLTRLVLVNAMYLKGEWETKFFEWDTKPAQFTRLDGSLVTVPMMTQQEALAYAHGPGWRASELGIRGVADSRPLAMTLILPDDLAAFEAGLSTAQLAEITTALDRQRLRAGEEAACTGALAGSMCGCHRYDVKLSLPRFAIDTHAGLVDALKSLGMTSAFDQDRADFTGIHVPETNVDRIYVTRVIHQANVDVDEKGTEAAAATAVVMTTGGCTGTDPLSVVTLRLDRPFLFVLRDVETGAVLFMGRVVDPSARG